MKHYDQVEWVLYKSNLLDSKIYEEMEEHLYTCDDCMEIFLSLIDEEEINQAGFIVPEDFTYKVMDSLKNIRPLKKKIERKSKVSNDFFIYYTAVASVAIILTAGGLFSKLVDSVPQITANISIKEEKIMSNAIYNFSEQITKKTSMFINDFQISKNKED
jgi:hypothetical protein